MKKVCISLFLIVIIVMTLILGIKQNAPTESVKYLRLHIRADSNDERDQAVKYRIKDEIVEYLTPHIATCDSEEKAEKMLNGNLKNIEKIADDILKEQGFEYRSSAVIKDEKFPTRVYEDLTLEEGIYRSLIINLGSGKGDNWWCVVYPPLCFTKGRNFTYKSKIYEIINKFKEKSKGG